PAARAAGLGTLRRHWLIITLLAAGAVLRALAWFAYQPALLYFDSFRYLENIGVYSPESLHPIGYDLFVLTPTLAVGGLALVTAIQHLAVLASALALYALALRHGARRWLAAIAAAPVLLDAYQIQIEQMIMSDAWQQVLLVALLWVLLGRGAPSPRRAALGGLLMGMAVLFRLVAVVLVVPAVCYLLIAGGAWRMWRSSSARRTVAARTVALLAVFVVVVGSYSAYFYAETGKWGLTRTTGNVLYGRTATVADCDRLDLGPLVRLACPEEPLGQRMAIDHYAHIGGDEDWVARFPSGTDITDVQKAFGLAVLRAQPLDVARAVVVDFLKGFRPTRTDSPGDVSVMRWHFQPGYQYYNHQEYTRRISMEFSGEAPSAVPALATFLRAYQLGGGYAPGTLLGAFGVVALLAGFGLGRARRSGIRSAALLAVGMAGAILLASAAFEFSWRYQLPGLVLLPFAGILGITALWRPRRS
ncbi:MAG: glycosyltransferase family 2 protein, partial [Pseudonocardiaceae bacterium]